MCRDSLSRCGSCTDIPGCRFCLTSLACVDGSTNQTYTVGDEEETCREFVDIPTSCPKLNSCNYYTSCATCVSAGEGCSWCESLDICMDTSEMSLVHCEGKIQFEQECPYPFTPTTEVEGNLLVLGDTEYGGGNLIVSGPCNKGDCNTNGFHSLTVDGGMATLQSGGYVDIQAADSNNPNVPASEILLQSGSNTNNVGGSGGDFFAFAGDAAGGKLWF